MAEHNKVLNQEERLRRFMETCKREREQYIAIKEKADEEKLAKVQAYVRQTLIPFDFTDEELAFDAFMNAMAEDWERRQAEEGAA